MVGGDDQSPGHADLLPPTFCRSGNAYIFVESGGKQCSRPGHGIGWSGKQGYNRQGIRFD
jgi:hypothetical protein